MPTERETELVLKRTLRIAAKVLSVPLGVALAMAGVSPSDAGSNLKAWLDLFGIEGIGDGWTSATDVWVMWVSGGLLAAFVIMLIVSYIPAVERHVGKWWSRDSRMSSVVAPAPIPTTWMSSDEARGALRRSSLIRMRVPNDVTLGHVLGRVLGDTQKTPGEVRTDELTRKLLRDFEAQHANGVRHGQYGKELLEWWIDEQANRMTP